MSSSSDPPTLQSALPHQESTCGLVNRERLLKLLERLPLPSSCASGFAAISSTIFPYVRVYHGDGLADSTDACGSPSSPVIAAAKRAMLSGAHPLACCRRRRTPER